MDKLVQSVPHVLLRTMGALRVSDRLGHELTPRSRKARALLAIIALEPGAVGRDRLADLLWSDRGPDQARSSLRQALFELRHLKTGEAELVTTPRDDIGLCRSLAWTDLDAIRHAVSVGDGDMVVALLESAGEGLLIDLDGLDREFDGWLRQQRAIEPAKTYASALALAETRMAAGDLAAASAIARQVQRLEPTSEEAARLGVRIAHRQGDSAAVNRHYRQLREALQAEFGVDPSRETESLMTEIGRRNHGPATDRAASPTARSGRERQNVTKNTARRWQTPALLGSIGLAGVAVLAWLAWPTGPSQDTGQLPLVAVLPFDENPPGDGSLAEGIWDDTRSSLSRAQAVRVLGRTTSEDFAARGLSPADYRDKLDVDYVLDGGVRRQGDRVRVTVSLIRTADGVAIWEHAFDGRLGDPMALQGAIASGIEGRIRGRLASGGGSRADQIPTTPEVYDLYVRSKHLLKARSTRDAREADALLNKAISLDPNFAPALALSAAAMFFTRHRPDSDPQWRSKAIAKANRAIDLAPSLAEAYAISALVEGFNGRSSERKLVRATTLDPGDAQSWLWLGNAYNSRGNWRAGQQAYRRAVDIDPYLAPALDNYLDGLLGRGDRSGYDELLRKLMRAGAGSSIVPGLKAQAAYHAGDISAGLNLVIPLVTNGTASPMIKAQAARGLLTLGDVGRAGRLAELSPATIALLEGKETEDMSHIGRELMINSFTGSITVRAAMNLDRGKSVVDAYHRNFKSAHDYVQSLLGNGEMSLAAPNVAIALAAAGYRDDALVLIEAADRRAVSDMAAQPANPDAIAAVARVKAAAGHRAEALRLLRQAIGKGWLPDGIFIPSDIALDPALSKIDGQEFRSLRNSILASISRERRELGTISI